MADSTRFVAQATVFILKNREWEEQGNGTVVFQFDTRTSSLILINAPDSKKEFRCRLKPRIRSKGPRAYVIRAETSSSDSGKMILAVRFEKEKESSSFREFVEANRLSGGGIDGDKAAADGVATRTRALVTRTGAVAATADTSRGATHGTAHVTTTTHGGAAHGHSHSHGVTPTAAGFGVSMATGTPHDYGGATVGYYQQMMAATPTKATPSGMAPMGEMLRGGGGHTAATGFFWTCSSCFQMNDALAQTCIVCSGFRPQPPKRVLDTGTGARHTAATSGALYRVGTTVMATPAAAGGRHLRGTEVEVCALTVDNLARHSRYCQPQRRSVKDMIVEQIKYCLTHQPSAAPPSSARRM